MNISKMAKAALADLRRGELRRQRPHHRQAVAGHPATSSAISRIDPVDSLAVGD